MSLPLSPAEAGTLSARLRKLLKAGKLTAKAFAVADALLWQCRNRSNGTTIASYATLRRLTHSAKDTIARALKALESVGIISRIRRRVWTPIGSRQAPSAFLWHVRSPAPESDGQAASGQREITLRIEQPTSVVEAAQRALADRRREIEARLLAKWSLGQR